MPYPNEHAFRIADPDKFQSDTFRTKEISPGIALILAKLKGEDTMTAQAYRFAADKFTPQEAKAWMKDHKIEYMTFEEAKKPDTMQSIHSSLAEKLKIDNGIWIPFLKDGQLAEDSQGKRYRLTKSAIDEGYKSYLGGFVNINHQERIKGTIAQVKRDGEFAYFKPAGLDEEALSVINSPAYRGVSQQSYNLSARTEPDSDGLTDVLSMKGAGVAIVLYPKTPGCPIMAGCGVPIASTTEQEINFSLNTSQLNSHIKSSGGTETNMANDESGADALKSITAERDALLAKVDALTQETTALKSTVSDPNKRIAELEKALKSKNEEMALTIKSTIDGKMESLREEMHAKEEYTQVTKELRNIMKRPVLESMLAKKPSLEHLKSTLEILKSSGLGNQIGAGSGQLTSTQETRIQKGLEELKIPSIEFSGGE